MKTLQNKPAAQAAGADPSQKVKFTHSAKSPFLQTQYSDGGVRGYIHTRYGQ